MFPLWAYLDRVRDAIVAAKYAHQAPLSDALGRRLAERLSLLVEHDCPDVVTFVPSHFSRQFSRGGNSNVTTATAVATRIGRHCRQLLRITRRIEKQAWLDEAERAKNVLGAFAPKKSYALMRLTGRVDSQIADRHILMVDDVMTTGATANEVAGVLKEAGANRVTFAVIARAVGS
ncbi:MAG: ComF family protein [Pirellulaceae bacterium]|nr:ComF family protein [Pirellulaceae bacterium]